MTEEEGKKFAKEINALFFLTSAKESVGINDLFLEIAKKYILYKSDYDNEQFGKKDFDLSKELIMNQKKKCC